MATIQKRGNSYRITVSYGYDARGKSVTEKSNASAYAEDPVKIWGGEICPILK